MCTPIAHFVHAALPSQLLGVVIKPQSTERLLTAKLPYMRTSSQASCHCKQRPHSCTAETVVAFSQGSVQSLLHAMTVMAASQSSMQRPLLHNGMYAGGMK